MGAPVPVHVGLDEAGRGSLFGPLVVGAFALPGYSRQAASALLDRGVKDSKLLTPGARQRVYAELKGLGTLATAAALPSKIDRYVEHGRLNVLEIELMADLATRLGASVVHVDACDPDAERFGRTLASAVRARGRKVQVYARHKADRDIPLVGAASIVAKVTRDRALARLQRESGRDLGSGYPSDPTTRSCARELVEAGAIPPWVRRSWKTFGTLKRDPHLLPLEAFVR